MDITIKSQNRSGENEGKITKVDFACSETLDKTTQIYSISSVHNHLQNHWETKSLLRSSTDMYLTSGTHRQQYMEIS